MTKLGLYEADGQNVFPAYDLDQFDRGLAVPKAYYVYLVCEDRRYAVELSPDDFQKLIGKRALGATI